MIERVQAQYPRISVIATTLREVHSASRHDWSAVACDRRRRSSGPRPSSSTSSTASAAATASRPASSTASSPGSRPSEALRLGWAHGALLTTYPGDTTMAALARGHGPCRRRVVTDPAMKWGR